LSGGIEDGDGSAVFAGESGEIAAALGDGGNGAELIEGCASAGAVPAESDESGFAEIEEMGNFERSANEGAEAEGVVAGFFQWKALE